MISITKSDASTDGSIISASTAKTNSSYRRHIERGEYAAAIEKSVEYEKKGDKLVKLGKHDLAQREYKKTVAIEEAVLGEEHPVVNSFREKIGCADDEWWQRSTLRKAMEALYSGLKFEKQGDYLLKNLAKAEYEKALRIEEAVLGENHPMTSSMKQKIIVSTN